MSAGGHRASRGFFSFDSMSTGIRRYIEYRIQTVMAKPNEPVTSQSPSPSRSDLYISLAVVVGVLIVGFALLDVRQRDILAALKGATPIAQQRNGQPPAQVAAPNFTPPPMPTEISIADAAFKGPNGAKAVMVEFSDFECPFCGRYVRDTLPQLDHDYVATGKIKYVFKNYPLENLHPNAFVAAQAGECARL